MGRDKTGMDKPEKDTVRLYC